MDDALLIIYPAITTNQDHQRNRCFAVGRTFEMRQKPTRMGILISGPYPTWTDAHLKEFIRSLENKDAVLAKDSVEKARKMLKDREAER